MSHKNIYSYFLRVMPEILKSEEDRHDNSMSISSEDDDIRELPRHLTEIIGKTCSRSCFWLFHGRFGNFWRTTSGRTSGSWKGMTIIRKE